MASISSGRDECSGRYDWPFLFFGFLGFFGFALLTFCHDVSPGNYEDKVTSSEGKNYRKNLPPLMSIKAPLMCDDMSLARNSTALATSGAKVLRPSGVCLR